MISQKPNPAADGLTRAQQHFYAAGHFGVSFMGLVITQWVMKFYFPDHPDAVNLVPPVLAPWIMFAGRISDGINDPLVGYLSDRVRTRWGRRKPFMVVGLPVLCLLFVLLWHPPHRAELRFTVGPDFQRDLQQRLLSSALRQQFEGHGISWSDSVIVEPVGPEGQWRITDGQQTYIAVLGKGIGLHQGESVTAFWFSTIVLVLFFLAFTIYTGPYLALLPEITHSVQQRLQISALQGVYNVSGLVAGALFTGVALKAGMSYQGMAWLVAGTALMTGMLPLLGAGDDPSRVADQPSPPFILSVVATLSNQPFLFYLATKVLALTALLLLVAGLPYMVETLLHRPPGEAGILSGLAMLSGVLCVPLILKLAQRVGRKSAFLFSLLWLAGSVSLLPLMALLGRYPDSWWPVWVLRALVLLSSVGVAGLFSLPYAFLADVTDYERQQSGVDRQGMFFCLQGLITKFAYALAPMTVTGLLATFPLYRSTVLMLIGPLAAVLALAAYAVFRAFPEEMVRQAVETSGSADRSAPEIAAPHPDEAKQGGVTAWFVNKVRGRCRQRRPTRCGGRRAS